MTKKIYDENIDEMLDSDIEAISIEDIDKEIENFYIDREKIESIKIPKNKNEIIKEAMKKAKAEMKAKQRKRYILGIASSISAVLCIGVYSPALAHSIPPLEKVLQNINDNLMIDEITSFTGIDKVFPRAIVDNEGKVKLEKPTNHKVNKDDINEDEANKYSYQGDNKSEDKQIEKNNNVEAPLSEYSSVQLIHQMSNSIIKAVDDRKYGQIPITPFNIDQAIEGIKYISDEGVATHLYNSLLKWREGDFSNAVLVHNFVWEMLDGEIGKAISVNHEKVNEIKNKYFN